jgi:microcystin-dependent protein
MNMSLHVGEYKWSARSNDFDGWLLCDGRSLSRTTYSSLYDILGTSFGSVDEDSFNLPDMRGRVMGCTGQASNLTLRTLGDAVGEERHSLSVSELPSHSHSASVSSAGSHNHGGNTINSGTHTHTINDPGHTHTQWTINDDYNSSGTNPPGFAADSAGLQTWNNINSAATGISINSTGDHIHGINSDGSHTHSVSLSSTGDGNSHNIMQPTIFAGNVFIFGGFYQ